MRKIFLYSFIYPLIIAISSAQSIPAFVYDPLDFILNLFFIRKKEGKKPIDPLSFINGSLKLDHPKIENYLRQLPTLTPAETSRKSTWEHTLKRNLKGVQPMTGLASDYKIIIDDILQDSENTEQVERIICHLKTKHSDLMPLLEQRIVTAYAGNVGSLLNIARSRLKEKAMTTMSARYLLDTKRQCIDYISTIILKKCGPNIINQAVQIHHSAKLDDSGQVKLSLNEYVAFDNSVFIEKNINNEIEYLSDEDEPYDFNSLSLTIEYDEDDREKEGKFFKH